MIKDPVARNNKYRFSFKANNSAMSFETIHGLEMLALTLGCSSSFGCRMRAHGLNCRARTLGIPAVLGQRERNTRRLGKYHFFFCLNKPGPTMVTAAFCSEHKEDKTTCEVALPVCRGFPLGRDHSAPSIRDIFVFHNAGNI